jgi:uncharacterized membrane protein YkoI
MSRQTLIYLAAAMALLVVFAATHPPAAVADEGPVAARKLSDAGIILPLEKIVAAAKAVKPGEILETELERKHERYVYEVEILDARGQVWEVKLDAKSGKLIAVESED